jgi:hypothetical protein
MTWLGHLFFVLFEKKKHPYRKKIVFCFEVARPSVGPFVVQAAFDSMAPGRINKLPQDKKR